MRSEQAPVRAEPHRQEVRVCLHGAWRQQLRHHPARPLKAQGDLAEERASKASDGLRARLIQHALLDKRGIATEHEHGSQGSQYGLQEAQPQVKHLW